MDGTVEPLSHGSGRRGSGRGGIRIARRYVIHYYDAALIAAAERLGALVLYTEDLNHGQRYGSVLVQNPFRDP